MRTMAELGADNRRRDAVTTADIAQALGRQAAVAVARRATG